MSKFTDELMKKFHFVGKASNAFMHQNKQRLTGQQRVLAILRLEDNLSQSYLQEVLDLRPSSLAELLKKLEDNGDITRKEDESDKRIKRVILTDQGREKADENASFKAEDISADFFSGLSEEEQQVFENLLDKISNGWDDDFKKQADSFVDPMDRFASMQKMRDEMMKKYGDDFENMSPDDIKHMRHEMRHNMKEMGGHGMGMHGCCGPGMGRHMRDGMRMGHRSDFWYGNRF
ncbi:MarR family winged helix-turn-helix transcriptional regulator [Companilactobacillus mishanensis]|uniref:MarR family winged helix-turn-helix transcriptional regulator n=1 Tax=Companilactobacillus mishanensis TaxID=2486008 RepID=UPI0012960A5E|nr:MarR family transcriptional regulator [Companilactobacillus mishanensis]MQS89570.1 MarR family transcriptional regulator [Companilactobacillus mishanensis]